MFGVENQGSALDTIAHIIQVTLAPVMTMKASAAVAAVRELTPL